MSDVGVAFIASLPNIEKLTFQWGTVGKHWAGYTPKPGEPEDNSLVNLELTDDGLVALLSMKKSRDLDYLLQRTLQNATDRLGYQALAGTEDNSKS